MTPCVLRPTRAISAARVRTSVPWFEISISSWLVVELHGADQRAVALGALDRDHALRAAALARIFGELGALAEAALGGGEDVVVAVDDDQTDDVLAGSEPHAAHAGRRAAHRAHFVFGETHGLAVATRTA